MLVSGSSADVKRADSQSPSMALSWECTRLRTRSLVIDWIDVICRVVPPAIAPGLRTGPVDDGSFTEGHLARRIAVVAGGVKHAWKY